jgi:hypothetical protein
VLRVFVSPVNGSLDPSGMQMNASQDTERASFLLGSRNAEEHMYTPMIRADPGFRALMSGRGISKSIPDEVGKQLRDGRGDKEGSTRGMKGNGQT